jgi:hypothetical protein
MDIMRYLLEGSVPAIVKEEKPKPLKTESISKTIGGLGGGLVATSERFGVGKSVKALHKSTKAKMLPNLVNKMGKFGTSKIGGAIAKTGAWGAGAGLAYGLADTLAGAGGAMIGSGLVGAGQKLRNKFKGKPKTNV